MVVSNPFYVVYIIYGAALSDSVLIKLIIFIVDRIYFKGKTFLPVRHFGGIVYTRRMGQNDQNLAYLLTEQELRLVIVTEDVSQLL